MTLPCLLLVFPSVGILQRCTFSLGSRGRTLTGAPRKGYFGTEKEGVKEGQRDLVLGVRSSHAYVHTLVHTQQ